MLWYKDHADQKDVQEEEQYLNNQPWSFVIFTAAEIQSWFKDCCTCVESPQIWVSFNVLVIAVAAQKPNDVSELEAFALKLKFQKCGIQSSWETTINIYCSPGFELIKPTYYSHRLNVSQVSGLNFDCNCKRLSAYSCNNKLLNLLNLEDKWKVPHSCSLNHISILVMMTRLKRSVDLSDD